MVWEALHRIPPAPNTFTKGHFWKVFIVKLGVPVSSFLTCLEAGGAPSSGFPRTAKTPALEAGKCKTFFPSPAALWSWGSHCCLPSLLAPWKGREKCLPGYPVLPWPGPPVWTLLTFDWNTWVTNLCFSIFLGGVKQCYGWNDWRLQQTCLGFNSMMNFIKNRSISFSSTCFFVCWGVPKRERAHLHVWNHHHIASKCIPLYPVVIIVRTR